MEAAVLPANQQELQELDSSIRDGVRQHGRPMPFAVAREAIIVFLISLAFLLFHISLPPYKLIDEKTYTVGAEMFHGRPDSNPEHPPLAKYLIALGIYAAGNNYTGWRLMPAVFGSLLMCVVFVWMSGIGRHVAWTAVCLIAANGFWFAMSRAANLTIFEITFSVLGLYLLDRRRYWLSGVAMGLAIACRWNALFALALAVCYAAFDDNLKSALKTLVAGICAYVVPWLPLVGLHPVKFVQSQLFILNYHRHFHLPVLTIVDPWYHWPIHTVPENTFSHLIANPLVTALGFIAVAVLMRRGNLAALAAIVFWLQWAITPRKFMYYYYYLDTLIMLSIAAAIAAGRYELKIGGRTLRLCVPVVMLSAAWFITHYPAFLGLQSPYDTMFQF